MFPDAYDSPTNDYYVDFSLLGHNLLMGRLKDIINDEKLEIDI